MHSLGDAVVGKERHACESGNIQHPRHDCSLTPDAQNTVIAKTHYTFAAVAAAAAAAAHQVAYLWARNAMPATMAMSSTTCSMERNTFCDKQQQEQQQCDSACYLQLPSDHSQTWHGDAAAASVGLEDVERLSKISSKRLLA
jgi:hypothetical protein